ncbi:MAG: class I SAM-dependent methyltransferase [Gemmataceae bacterium]|nr:class I SAM-dependent methyltransferase [Gemmataceae bacterium]MCI0742867.1 class I SAM-dependent methyltransferase [Gemmataceae bacterium]
MAPPTNTLPDRTTFEIMYAGKPPWEINKPQQPFLSVADEVVSPVLDAGCGTGENALFLAARGHQVTGIDFVEDAIRRARHKAAERSLSVRFLVKDVLTLGDWDERFSSVIDSGLFHVFSDDDRRRYVQGLRHVVEAGGRLFLMCFSDGEPGTQGPRRVSWPELYDAFAEGWEVKSVHPVRFEVNPEVTDFSFSKGGPKAWFAVIKRNE